MKKTKGETIKTKGRKRITLVLLVVMLFNIIVPNYSNAGFITTTVINKAVTGLCVLVIDSVNRSLAIMFKIDTLGDIALDGFGNIKTKWEDEGIDQQEKEENFMNKFTEVLEKTTDSLTEAEKTWYKLLLSPDDIFSGNVKIADANIFTHDPSTASEWTFFGKLLKELKKAVAGLYYTMRNLAVIILLCLLIYSGIKIILSANSSQEKAKWKTYLYDWLKALALVMFVHVIMIGIFAISDTVVDGLSGALNDNGTIVSEIRQQFNRTSFFDVTSNWFYVIMYAYVTYITIVFLIAYFKRLIYVMVLVIIAPVVSSLYAFGKTSKKIFNNWFREFTMGVFVQPFHMLIYSILLLLPLRLMNGSGFTEGTVVQMNYPSIQIYALISLSMIRPIEKYMRTIFEFGHTSIDNVASFESGKQTLDAGKEVAVKAVEVAAVVATAGAAAPALAGGAAASASAGGAAASTAAEGATVAKGATAASGEAGLASNSLLQADGSLLEAQNIMSEDATLDDLRLDSYNEDWTAEDYNAYDELYNEQNERKARFGEQQARDMLDNANQSSENGNSTSNGAEIVLNNANVEINNAKGIDVGNNAEGVSAGNNSGRISTQDVQNQDKNSNQNVLDTGSLATALLGRLGGKYEESSDKLFNPGMLEQGEDLRGALHKLTDSFYVPNTASGDWKADMEFRKEFIDNKKQEMVNKFVNNKQNQDEAIRVFNLHDKKDKNGEVIQTAQEQAKEKLEKAAPYISLGIKDVQQLKDLSSMGTAKPYQALRQYSKDQKQEIKYNEFVNNNVHQMETIVADKLGKLAEFRSGDQNVVEQVNQQVTQNFAEGKPYVTQGLARDSETLHRLLELERKIDKRVVISETPHHTKESYIAAADKIIEKAVDKNIKKIKLPVNKQLNGNPQTKAQETSIKELQKVMNEALKERRDTLNGGNNA